MAITDDIADGLEEIEADIPLTFTWEGFTLPCTAGSGVFSKTLGQGGWATDSNRTINVRLAVFTTAQRPSRKETLVFSGDGLTYRIDDIENPPGNPFMVLKLIDPTKGV